MAGGGWRVVGGGRWVVDTRSATQLTFIADNAPPRNPAHSPALLVLSTTSSRRPRRWLRTGPPLTHGPPHTHPQRLCHCLHAEAGLRHRRPTRTKKIEARCLTSRTQRGPFRHRTQNPPWRPTTLPPQCAWPAAEPDRCLQQALHPKRWSNRQRTSSSLTCTSQSKRHSLVKRRHLCEPNVPPLSCAVGLRHTWSGHWMRTTRTSK